MREIVSLLLGVLLFSSCGTKLKEVQEGNPPSGPEGLQYPTLSTVNTEFSSREKMATLMNFLASDALKGRDSGSEGIAFSIF